jgi:hypothetical protein
LCRQDLLSTQCHRFLNSQLKSHPISPYLFEVRQAAVQRPFARRDALTCNPHRKERDLIWSSLHRGGFASPL